MKAKNIGAVVLTAAFMVAGSMMSFADTNGAELINNYKAKVAGAQSVTWNQQDNMYETHTSNYDGTSTYKNEAFSTVLFNNGCRYTQTTGQTGSDVYGYNQYSVVNYKQKVGDNIHNVEMNNGVVGNVSDYQDALMNLNTLDAVLNVHGDEVLTTAVDGTGNPEYVVYGHVTKDEFSKSELALNLEELMYTAVSDIGDSVWVNPTYEAHFDAATGDLKSITVDASPAYTYKEQSTATATGGTDIVDYVQLSTFNNIKFNEGTVVMPA